MMKRILFYCQHILGIGHLLRSMAIAQGLTSSFEVYFVNGGEMIPDFPVPQGIQVINLPVIKADSESKQLQVPKGFTNLDTALEYRRDFLLKLCDHIQPHVVMVERFPFAYLRFSAELIPLLERAKTLGAKICCSLRDIIVPRRNQAYREAKVCRLIDRYFDQLLIHGDPQLMPLEQNFSRVSDLNCEIHYTGYVVPQPDHPSNEQAFNASGHSPEPSQVEGNDLLTKAHHQPPTIVVSVGSGRCGAELLEAVAHASQWLQSSLPHQIHMFTGLLSPEPVHQRLKAIATQRPNLTVARHTPYLLQSMAQADLSISLAGYNSTLNVLQTGVRALFLPAWGKDRREQYLRSHRLEDLGVAQVIRPEELVPEGMARKILTTLQQTPNRHHFHLRGVEITATRINTLIEAPACNCA